jgi:hypothetical protein
MEESMKIDGGIFYGLFIYGLSIVFIGGLCLYQRGKPSEDYLACLSKRSEFERVFMQNQMTVRELPNGWLVSKGDDGSPTFVEKPKVIGFFGVTSGYCSPK